MRDDTELDRAIAKAGLPGASCMIVDRDGVRYSRAFGFADTAAEIPMREDTPCQIASMTKALVSIAAMQLVEQGKLSLDAPIGDLLPDLADPQVMTGFAEDGSVQTRPAVRPITLRHLLTHTAGLGYVFVQDDVLKYFMSTGMPAPGSRASITMPLMFDPGDKWEYSVATDWVGLAIEAVTGSNLDTYLAEHVSGPLGMTHTAFHKQLPEGAAKVHMRTPEGGLAPSELYINGGEFNSGGGGLISTAPDYGRFIRMLLGKGELEGTRILPEATFAEMSRNQIGDIRAGYLTSSMPDLAGSFDFFPEQHTGWGLGFLINPDQVPGGRSPGSLAWCGIFNSYFWADPAAGIGGVLITQLSPFGDPAAVEAFKTLERMAYG